MSLIKKYGNRRLYHTGRSQYITLEDLVEMVAAGDEVMVVDTKTGADLTKRTLTQLVLLEEERHRMILLPVSFLRRLIQGRDPSLREFFQRYLTLSLEVFLASERELSRRVEEATTGPPSAFSPEALQAVLSWMARSASTAGQPPLQAASLSDPMRLLGPQVLSPPLASALPWPQAGPVPPPAQMTLPGISDPEPDAALAREVVQLRARLSALESRLRQVREAAGTPESAGATAFPAVS